MPEEQLVAGPSLSLTLRSERASCERARLALLAFLAPRQPSDKAIFQIEVVLEESLMNQIWHAFPDQRTDHELGLRAEVVDDAVVLQFTDHGVHFNPLNVSAPKLPKRLEDATPGGLGIFLTRKYARSAAYQRCGDENRLTVVLGLH